MLGLFGEMFSNVGGKLKGVALVLFFLTWIGGILTGLFVFFNGVSTMIPLGLLIILVSILPAYLISLPIYAFGQLVENWDAVNYRLYDLEKKIGKQE